MKNLLSILCVIATMGFLCLGCDKREKDYPSTEETKTADTKITETKKTDISDKDEQGLLIRPRIGVGDIRLEMAVDEVMNMLGEPDDTYGRSLEYASLGISVLKDKNNPKAVEVIICGDTSGENPYLAEVCECRTKEGIKIGSSKNDIIRAYGQPSKIIKDQRLLYEKLGILFILADDKVICIWVTNR